MLRSRPSLDDFVNRHEGRYKWLALTVVALGMVAAVLSTTSFGVAIPALMRDFGLGQDQVQWVMTGFMGAMTVSMLPTPWLLDRLGFRRCFIGALVVLAASSIAGSLSPHFSCLVAARLVQGAAAGLLQPLAAVAVMRLFPVESQGQASGILGFSIVLAPAVAPALGGILLDRFGWPAIFLINLPFCLVAGGAALFLLPQFRETRRLPFDWLGVGLLGVATLCMVGGVASLQHGGLTAPQTLLQLGAILAAVGLFIRHGLMFENAVIRLKLFRVRSFAMGTLVSFIFGFGLYASAYLIPVFLQRALGYSASAAGLSLLPSGLALALAIPVAGRLADRYPPRWITMAGLSLCGSALLMFAARGGNIGYQELIAVTVIVSIGQALTLIALSLGTLRHMEIPLLGQSSMVTSYVRQLGGVLGIAVAAVFVEWREAAYGTVSAGVFTAFSQGFLLLAIAFFLALIAASQMRRPSAQ